jgi:hypothetical protein
MGPPGTKRDDVKSRRQTLLGDSLGKRAIAGALFAVLVFVQSLAASPALHAHFHEDATAPGHYCAVKLFSQGQVDVSDPGTPVQPPDWSKPWTIQRRATAFLAVDHFLAPSRAPPSYLG